MGLMSILKRIWLADSSGVFSSNSFYKHLLKSPHPSKFLISFGRQRSQKRLRGFVWTLTLNKVNTLDNLQVRHLNRELSPSICDMCYRGAETVLHLFLHCASACVIVVKIFGIRGRILHVLFPSWIFADELLGFGRNKVHGLRGMIASSIIVSMLCLFLIFFM